MTQREMIWCALGSLGFLLAAIATYTHLDWKLRVWMRTRRARRRGGMLA